MPRELRHSTTFPVSVCPGGSHPGTLYLLDLKLLLALDALAVRALSLLGDRRIAHLNIGHGGYSVRRKD